MKIPLFLFFALQFSVISCADDIRKLDISDFIVNTNITNYSFSINESINNFYRKTNYLEKANEGQFRFLTGGIYNSNFLLSQIKQRMIIPNYIPAAKSERMETRQFPVMNLYLFSERIDWIIIWNTKSDSQLRLVEDLSLKNPVTTARGIKIGDLKSKVLDAYGQPFKKEERDSENLIMIYSLKDPTPFSNKYEIVFEIISGKVHAIFFSNVYKDEFKRKETDFSIIVKRQRISLLDPIEAVKLVLGEPDRIDFIKSKIEVLDLYKNIYQGVVFSLQRRDSSIRKIIVNLPGIETSRGIQIGDNKNRVISVYGDDFFEEKNIIRYKLNIERRDQPEIYSFNIIYFLYFYFNEKNEVKSFVMEEGIPED